MEYESRHTKKRKHEVSTENSCIRPVSKSAAAPTASANGPGTADPSELEGKTLHEWLEFVSTTELKLHTLNTEVDELDEKWIGYAAVDMLETLEHIFHPVRTDLRDKMAGKCNNLSDLIAFLPSFRKAINRKIADIEHLVKATKTVNDTSAIDLMLDGTSYPYPLGY